MTVVSVLIFSHLASKTLERVFSFLDFMIDEVLEKYPPNLLQIYFDILIFEPKRIDSGEIDVVKGVFS